MSKLFYLQILRNACVMQLTPGKYSRVKTFTVLSYYIMLAGGQQFTHCMLDLWFAGH